MERLSKATAVCSVLLLSVLANAAAFLLGAYRVLSTRQSVGYIEGVVGFYVNNLHLLFHPIEEYPYIMNGYPPVYYLVSSAVNLLVSDSLIAGRLVSISAVLGASILIGHAVYTLDDGSRYLPSVLAALGFLFSPYVTSSGVIAKPDPLALFFSVLAIYFYLTKRGTRRLWLTGAALFVLLWTKQNFLAAPVAVFVAMTLKEWKRSVTFAGVLAIAGVGVLGTLTVLTDGQAFLHLVKYNQNEFILSRLVERYYEFLTRHGVLIAIGTVGVVYYRRALPNVVIAYVVAGSATGLLIGKTGAGVNYFFEVIAALSLLAGVTALNCLPARPLRSLASAADREKKRRVVAVLAVFAVCFGLFIAPPNSPVPGGNGAAAAVAGAERDVLAWDPAILLQNNQDMVYQPIIMSSLANQGIWDQSKFVSTIRNHKYSYIVTRGNVNETEATFGFTTAGTQAIQEEYVLRSTSGAYYVYEPRNATRERVPRATA